MDGSSLPPLIIFKGENLSHQWILASIHNNWRFGCNTKEWTSNEHGLKWLREIFEPATLDKADGKPCLLICDGHDSHITALWIAHYMKNNIIFMVLPPYSSHFTQPLDVGVFNPLKTLMASAIEPLLSTELHRILKAEWLSAYVEAHDKAFSAQNIQAGFRGTRILPFNPSKVIDRVKQNVEECIQVRCSTPIEFTTPFKNSVLTSSPVYTDEACLANAALWAELSSGGPISTPARNYTKCVVRRSGSAQVRSLIIEEEHTKLKEAVTTRKTILSGKRQVIDGKHILTTPEILTSLTNAEKRTKKRKATEVKKGKKRARQAASKASSESESSQDESVVVLDCIEVET